MTNELSLETLDKVSGGYTWREQVYHAGLVAEYRAGLITYAQAEQQYSRFIAIEATTPVNNLKANKPVHIL